MPDFTDDLALARRLADLADAISLARFRATDLVVETKPDLTPVSDADRAVERELRDELARARPDDAVSGEELGSAGSGARRWVLDPIDGTKNYVRGVPVWATLVALLDGDDAVVGVVSAPALGRRWWAARGLGAFGTTLGGEPTRLAVSRVAQLADASMSYSSLGGWRERGVDLEAVTAQLWRSRAYGDFWSHMLVAEGAVDIAAEPELSLWDMAALAPIVVEAGGRFTAVDGRSWVHGDSAATSNGLLHDALLAALRPQH
ncbi:histidinol-phosphate phosphatase [Jatrophihabitans endophyticus]|uniref:Histidinol-phosphatase n=1 Tax=Jatrophihabitans endophyticus TaxID=1206085 RepID=A0A1M5EBI2_9ACTN|nr:inositol monophosphatase family protein [Jatrophihabitans endophyticus]SHF76623.1 histidinol-phosphate phosphatase [Jatrophihabitans endophyticus]